MVNFVQEEEEEKDATTTVFRGFEERSSIG